MKELYIAILEELLADGMDYDEAGERAYELMQERLADMADNERKRRKESQ